MKHDKKPVKKIRRKSTGEKAVKENRTEEKIKKNLPKTEDNDFHHRHSFREA